MKASGPGDIKITIRLISRQYKQVYKLVYNIR